MWQLLLASASICLQSYIPTVGEFSGLEFCARYYSRPQDWALNELVPKYIDYEGALAAFIGRDCQFISDNLVEYYKQVVTKDADGFQ